MKRIIKLVGALRLLLFVITGGYVAYVFIDYHRLPDMDMESPFPYDHGGEALATAEPYRVVTWNLGFGAYSDDYSFFMDGGKESRALSREAVLRNISHAVGVLDGLDASFKLLQEIDFDSTRTYKVDEVGMIADALGGYRYFGQNYDSPYLFYPVTRPHGASKSGLLTLSTAWVDRLARISLPVETGFMKLLDLDRCYSKSWIPMTDGRHLVLYNLHLSAYSKDGTIADEQLALLTADMKSEYEAGNYVVGGGDFNKDLPGNSPEVFGTCGEVYSWAQPLKNGAIPEGLKLVYALDPERPIPTCRNTDTGYVPGKTFVVIVDGFIVSDNVKVVDCQTVDEGFAASDHNPVAMTFELEPSL